MKKLLALIFTFYVASSYVLTTNIPSARNKKYSNVEYLVGVWESKGFVTDAKGLQQIVTLKQKITNVNEQDLKIVGTGMNPTNGFKYNASKTLYYNTKTEAWYVKGSIEEKYAVDNKVYITDHNTITFTFYDGWKNLMRYTITKENNDAFTETEEIWTVNGWDKTAWLRSTRVPKSYNTVAMTTDRPIH